ncbi:MAG: EF-hand domain-containing protein [Syntrophaceae bacterium]
MKHAVAAAVTVLMVIGLIAPVYAAGPPEANARNAFKMILSGADANKDGKLTVNECMGIYKDKNMATKNCTFWDVNKDGFITEDEYVKQGMSLGNR